MKTIMTIRGALAVMLLILTATSARGEVLQEWDFTSGSTLGWAASAGVQSMTADSSGLNLTVTAADPYVFSPQVSFASAVNMQLIVEMKTNTSDPNSQIFYGSTFTAEDSLGFTTTNDNAFHTYTLDLPPFSSGYRVRIDPGSAAGNVVIASVRLEGEPMQLDNGVIKIGMDIVNSGGAITYLSESGTSYNLINNYDRGRQIQQSYYAGMSIDRTAEGQSPSWSPWAWNPIQVGDTFGNSSEVVEASIVDGVAYTKTIPLLWDMNNEPGQCIMEQWTRLEENRAHVRCKLTVNRDEGDIWTQVNALHQELPAVYTIADLPYLYTYLGDSPFQNEPLTQITRIIIPGAESFPWNYWPSAQYPGTFTEKWAANVNASDWGVGVYYPDTEIFAGGFVGSVGGGEFASSTGYISPIRSVALDRDSVFEYEYTLIVGYLDEIRNYVYLNRPQQAFGQFWDFEKDGDSEGWNAYNHITNETVIDSKLDFTVTGNDPILLSPPLMIDSDRYQYIHIRMKNSTLSSTAQIFWTNAEGGPGTPGHSFGFSTSTFDIEMQDYFLDMSEVPGWSGTISQLRLDPTGISTGQVAIDWIAIWASTNLFTQASPIWNLY